MKDKTRYTGDLIIDNINSLDSNDIDEIVRYINNQLNVYQSVEIDNCLKFFITASGLNEYRLLLDTVEYISNKYNTGVHLSNKDLIVLFASI